MIPQDKSAAVLRGLHEAFGTTAIEDIRTMPQGLSSDLLFRIVVQQSPYQLRILTRMDEIMDPARIFASMSAAATAGLAPRVHYSSAQDGIAFTDFVEAVPYPASQALVEVPTILRQLHELPPFPKAFNYVTAHNGFIWKFRKAGLLPQPEVDEIFNRYEELCAVYPLIDSDLVSCHNDLKPEHIVFDGHRTWLVGWQAAMRNDRYFDLAIAANYLLTTDEDESAYLTRYFGQKPDDYQRARFFLMRQVMHMFSATIFLLFGSAGKPVNLVEELPSFVDFHQRIWKSEVSLADAAAKILCGRVHWRQLLENMHGSRFDEALRVVSERDSPSRLLPHPQ